MPSYSFRYWKSAIGCPNPIPADKNGWGILGCYAMDPRKTFGERKLPFYPCHKTLRIKLMPSFQPSFFITNDDFWWGHYSHLKKHPSDVRHKTQSGKSGVWQYEKLMICIFILILSAFLLLSYCAEYWSHEYTRGLRYYSQKHSDHISI
jgi:hypothetical protein